MAAVWEALLDYWGSMIRPRSSLARRIVALLVFKLVAILALWLLFFSPISRPEMNDTAVENNLLSAVPHHLERNPRDV